MSESITILATELLDQRQIVITFSDRTYAVFAVEDLLAYAPDRREKDSSLVGE